MTAARFPVSGYMPSSPPAEAYAVEASLLRADAAMLRSRGEQRLALIYGGLAEEFDSIARRLSFVPKRPPSTEDGA